MNKLIDLRSDTGTLPTEKMRIAMQNAEVGDDGRVQANGKSEDSTVAQLESLSALQFKKEDALFCPSGTMANIISILTTVKRREIVALDKNSHIYSSETSIFSDDFFGRKAVFIETDSYGIPNIPKLVKLFTTYDIKLLCLENTVAFYGGTCLSAAKIEEVFTIARKFNVPVHIDGARIFNASTFLKEPVAELVQHADTVMFCLSKGLGAPIGSLLCGSEDFISEARKVRKAIGGNMRQSGIVAAAGIVALNETKHITRDHDNALLLFQLINHNQRMFIDTASVQTNIVKIDVSNSGLSASKFKEGLKNRGLFVKLMAPTHLRLVLHKEITAVQVERAALIINSYCEELEEKHRELYEQNGFNK